MDQNFSSRYDEYWESQNREATQGRLWSVLGTTVDPWPQRLSLDIEVAEILGVRITADKLRELYKVLVQEMILTRRLAHE